jgi:2-polyprenyl-3-methyl-5-hydroxy-6-metoxy-1,4-benzoquinol methylase
MKPISPAGFEQKFLANIDPWNYTTSAFERYKRDVLLRACGCRTFGRGLELACAIGMTSRCLAQRCLRLLAVDSSLTALAEAKRRTRDSERITFRQALLPNETPRGPFDLIIASEIAYYIDQHALYQLLRKLEMALSPNGRIVFLNHTRQFDDAAQLPALAHKRLRRKLENTMHIVFHERQSRFDVVAFQKPWRGFQRQLKALEKRSTVLSSYQVRISSKGNSKGVCRG